MPADPLDGLVVRAPSGDDHRRVLATIDPWWGGLGGEDASARRAMLVSRLFSSTSPTRACWSSGTASWSAS
jgi:hypothetical protein